MLTDIPGAAHTLSGVCAVEPLTSGPYGVGTRWRETRRMFGKASTEELRVTAAEKPARTVVEADSGGVHYVTEFRLAASGGDATQLMMAFSATQSLANGLRRCSGACSAASGPGPRRR